jgi:hypothetical protein
MNDYEFFVTFVHTEDGRDVTGNGTFTIQGGIESIDDVRMIEAKLGEDIPAVNVRLTSWRPFLPGSVEFASLSGETATETTTVEHVTVLDEPAWGSRY